MLVFRTVYPAMCCQAPCFLGHPTEMEPLVKVRAPPTNLGICEKFHREGRRSQELQEAGVGMAQNQRTVSDFLGSLLRQ